jgi:hypothetical protein
MEPAFIVTMATALIGTCLRVGRGLGDLIAKYGQSAFLISSICAECTIIRISLSQVEHLVKNEPEILSSQPHLQDRVGPCLDVALAGCARGRAREIGCRN